jgi:hypothetical protein
LLETASLAIGALQTGKSAGDEQGVLDAKQQFETSTNEYFSLLESISVKLRQEIKLLHNVSKEKVLPLSLPAKAVWLGREKEDETWRTIDNLLEAAKAEGS